MALKKFVFKPGINRETTQLAQQGGWYDASNVRFRGGFPEKLGGWVKKTSETFLGICRSLFRWTTLGGAQLMGVGTNLKFYLEHQGVLYDITPIRRTAELTNPFYTTEGSLYVTVVDTDHGALLNDYITFSGAVEVGGLTLNGTYTLARYIDIDSYDILVESPATATVAGGGGTVTAVYEINTGFATTLVSSGWGGGYWGSGTWGTSGSSNKTIRLWSQANFGEDLVFGPRGGALYYWDANTGFNSRGVALTSLTGASDVPLVHNSVIVSDVSRFVICLGVNELGSVNLDPMLIRWSDQEDITNWTPSITNQAGGIRLSTGSEIITAHQMRQEIIVFTDTSLYSMQYQGPPYVWGLQLIGADTTIISTRAIATAMNMAFWMGESAFYMYNGAISPLPCTLQRYVFNNLNRNETEQIFAGTSEAFNEVWWFYPSEDSDIPNKVVIYNYLDRIWYKGDITRYAWCESAGDDHPIAATENTLVLHEVGLDDYAGEAPLPLTSYIESSEVDIADGENISLVNRIVPDITFRNSNVSEPSVDFTIYPMRYPGSGYGDSVAGTRSGAITKTVTASSPEQFSNQLHIRVRGRQLVVRIDSDGLGVSWQLGSPALDIRPDGRR